MTMRIARAAMFACLMGTASAVVLTASTTSGFAADKSTGPTVSAAVGKALQPAQKALEAKDYKTAMDLAKQAQALPDQTPTDTYEINNFIAAAALGLNDYATADAAYEAMADSPALPDTERQTILHNATLLATQAKHYDKAIKYGAAYLAIVPNDATIIGTMAQAYYFSNDFNNAATFADKALASTPPGQAPNRGALEIELSSQIKAKQNDAALKTMETIVTYYNDADDWAQIIDFSLGAKGIHDMEALHIYRLRLAAHASGKPADFTLPANLCLQQNMSCPVESVAFLQAGGVGGGDLSKAQAAASRDRAVLPAFENAAKKGGGELLLKLAETYYGYGRYADAEATARAALAKGGAKMDPNEAHMLIGESLVMQGKTADAVAAFDAVSNPTPGWAKAQHIWLLFANRKYGASTPSQ